MSFEAWDISSLYHSMHDPNIPRDLKRMEKLIDELDEQTTEWVLQDSCSITTLEDYFRQLEEITNSTTRIDNFIQLSYSADMTVENYRQLTGVLHIQQASVIKINTRFEAYMAGFENVDAMIEESAYLKEFGCRIKELIERHSYRFSDDIELMVKRLMQTGLESWANVQLRNVTSNTIPYEGKELSLFTFRNLQKGTGRTQKAHMNQILHESYVKLEQSSLEALNNIKGDVLAISEARGYASPLDEVLKICRMSEETLNAMLQACSDSMENLREYYCLKAKRMGYSILPFYEINNTLDDSGAIGKNFDITTAEELITSSFNEFSPALAECARNAFSNKWIDYLPRKNKSRAAFCKGIYPQQEFRILLNYDFSLSSVRTLAHELGHGYHGLKLGEQTVFLNDVTAVTAETGSTFCEAVFGNYLENIIPENELIAYYDFILSGQVGAVIDCLSAFYFEKELFFKRSKGALTVSEMQEATLQGFRKCYGDAVDIETYNKNIWISKLHLYNPSVTYYNFPYTFGLLFSLAIYNKFKEIGSDFIPLYDHFLKKTGSATVEELGTFLGIDVKDSSIWKKSIRMILEKKDLLKELL